MSSAGTTNTGAVDPLNAIADLCAREGLWHHVDGAYGAFFYMCPELRDLMPGLSRADSLTLDPHKGLFLPYGTGALLVRDGAALRRAHEATASYLPNPPEGDDFYDPHQYGPELSRGFPGLRVWLCVKLYGAGRFRAALKEKRSLALEAAARVATVPGIVMVAPPQVSALCVPPSLAWLQPGKGEHRYPAPGGACEPSEPRDAVWCRRGGEVPGAGLCPELPDPRPSHGGVRDGSGGGGGRHSGDRLGMTLTRGGIRGAVVGTQREGGPWSQAAERCGVVA